MLNVLITLGIVCLVELEHPRSDQETSPQESGKEAGMSMIKTVHMLSSPIPAVLYPGAARAFVGRKEGRGHIYIV